jgi:hypothetical protein
VPEPTFVFKIDSTAPPGDVARPLAALLLDIARRRLAAKQPQPLYAPPDQGTLSEALNK